MNVNCLLVTRDAEVQQVVADVLAGIDLRYQLTLEAILITRDERVIPAQILNVSDGGLALRLLDRAHLHGAVTIRFVIPGAKTRVIVAKVTPCWATEPIFGMQFVEISKDSRSAYDDWLKSMALV